MKLINGFQLIEYAKQNHLLIPAFNTTNLEMTYAIAKGLSNANIPGYIQISSNNLRLSNPHIIADIARDAVKNTTTPIGLHLDHGRSFEDIKTCVDTGFTSIMIDASALPYKENIAMVRRTAEYCHFYGLPVEAELGTIHGKEEDIACEVDKKTDPEIVADFIERSGCDILAVSVGNVHGLNIEPRIDLPLLKRISEVSKVPLVLHGGSGIAPEVIWEAKKYGLVKINYGSDLRKEFISTFGKAYEKNHNEHDVIHLSMQAVENVARKVQELSMMINRY
jgi:ketose-bisphosphate aldolase